MSGVMKTMSNFCQNFRASLPATAGRVAYALLEKAGGGGVPSRRVGAASPGALLQADTKWGPKP